MKDTFSKDLIVDIILSEMESLEREYQQEKDRMTDSERTAFLLKKEIIGEAYTTLLSKLY